MLGAEMVITGVGPAVAQRMVQLGVEFGSVVTQASLERGIAYALTRTGCRLARGRAAGPSAR
jgi:anti-anti-sigma regulatory factor